MANNYRNTRIPSRAEDGTPTSYFIIDEDNNHQAVTRAVCLAHDEQGAPPLYVSPDGANVFRMPRTELGEQLALENRHVIWNEEQRTTRSRDRIEALNAPIPTDDEVDFDIAADINIAQIVEDKAELDTLLAAVRDALTEPECDLLHAIFVDGKTERELAPLLGLKEPKSVNKRKHSALRKLHAYLTAKGYGKEI